MEEIFGMNGISHMICYVLILLISSALKKLRFWQNRKEVLNSLNFACWVELYVQRLYKEITWRNYVIEFICRYHVHYLGWSAPTNERFTNREDYKIGFSADSLRVKCKCQLIVRLKANKYYQKLLYYLFFNMNLLNIRFCSQLKALGRFQIFSPSSRTPTKTICNTGGNCTYSFILANISWLMQFNRS